MPTTRHDTQARIVQTWASYAVAMVLTAWGLLRREINPRYKALLALSWLCLISSTSVPAMAHGPSGGSELSALSMLPVAVSVAAPVALLSAGAALTVVAVEASATGTVWVLERASDGVRGSVLLSADVAHGASVLVGSAVLVTALSAGWVLSAAGKAIAFVPNELGRALLHNERVTR